MRPLNLRRSFGTGHGPADPTTRVIDGHIWQTTYTSQGPATLHLWQEQERVLAEAWGAGAEAIIDRVPDLVGAGDDPSEIAPKDDLIARAKRRHPGLRLTKGRAAIELLVPIILGQRVTAGEAQGSYRHMVYSLGEPAPGPNDKLRLPPTPKAIRKVPMYALHRYGVERARGRVLLEACFHPRFVNRIANMPGDEAVAHLQKLPGVGAWTANLVVAGALGYPDAVPVGDYHLKNVIGWALAGEARASDERMLELLEPYAGQRWRAMKLIFAEGISAPKRGPRRAAFKTYVDLAERRRR